MAPSCRLEANPGLYSQGHLTSRGTCMTCLRAQQAMQLSPSYQPWPGSQNYSVSREVRSSCVCVSQCLWTAFVNRMIWGAQAGVSYLFLSGCGKSECWVLKYHSFQSVKGTPSSWDTVFTSHAWKSYFAQYLQKICARTQRIFLSFLNVKANKTLNI